MVWEKLGPGVILMLALSQAPARAGGRCDGEVGTACQRECEQQWPRQARAPLDQTWRCARFFDAAYVKVGTLAADVVWKLTTDQLQALAAHVEACGTRCDRSVQVAAWFRAAANTHFDLIDPVTHESIEPLLGRLLAGKAIGTQELVRVSGVTLWRLRNAPFARHGRPFKNDDLQQFFYGERKVALPSKLLPLAPNPGFTDSMLDAADKENLATIASEAKARHAD